MKKLHIAIVGVVVVGFALLSSSTIAMGADWKYIGTFDNCKGYVDVSSVRTLSGGIKKFWLKAESDAKGDKCAKDIIESSKKEGIYTKDFENFKYELLLFNVNCSTGQFRISTIRLYDNKKELHIDNNASPWLDIVPESQIASASTALCPKVGRAK